MKIKSIIGLMLGFFSLLFFGQCSGTNGSASYTSIAEAKVYTLSGSYSDRIIKITREEGEEVKEGEPVIIMDSTTVFLQFKQNQEMIDELKLQLANARTQLKQAEDQMRYMSDLYQKNIDLAAKNAIPDQQLEDIKLKFTNASRQLEMAQTSIQILQKKLEQAKINSEILAKRLQDARITAPTSGIVDKIYYEVGEIPPPYSPILDLVNLDEAWCTIYVSETDLPSIKIGQNVKVYVDNYSEPLNGKIVHVNKQAEFTPKNILTPDNRKALVFGVKIDIDNPNHVIKPGMPVEVEL